MSKLLFKSAFPLDSLILSGDGNWGFGDDSKTKLTFGDYVSDEDAASWWSAAQGATGYGCVHEWVDVGFQFSKIVCKKCNVEKTDKSEA